MRSGRFAAVVAVLVALALPAAAAADSPYTTRQLVSTGSPGGNGPFAAEYAGSAFNGRHVFFTTNEQLVGADTDARVDIYDRSNGTTTLVSTGPAGGNGGFDAVFSGTATPLDGTTHVFFTTAEKLVSGDTDSQTDVYERTGGVTTLVSTGPSGGNGSFPAFFDATSGDRVFFHTRERLEGDDNDGQLDIYERAAGTTTLVSQGDAGGSGPFDAYFGGISSNGTHVYFETNEILTSDDTDASQDVYERVGSTTTRISYFGSDPSNGNGAFDAFFDGNSDTGGRAWFSTDEPLAGANGDADSQFDVYERAGATSKLISRTTGSNGGPFDALFAGALPPYGEFVFFETDESMLAQDTDSTRDVYMNTASSGMFNLSTGPAGGNGEFDARFAGVGDSGAYIETDESLTADDTDAETDVYLGTGFVTERVSAGAATGSGNGAFDASFAGAVSGRAFFTTLESLSGLDTDSARDVYEWSGNSAEPISNGPAGGNGPFNASIADVSEDGFHVYFTTNEQLMSGDLDSSQDVYDAGIPSLEGYARPKGATPVVVALVPAFAACANPNTNHGAPLAAPSCAPPSPSSNQLTVGTPDSNGRAANFIGKLRLDVATGDSNTTADEADVLIAISATDIRRKSDLSDYTGELDARIGFRRTDRDRTTSDLVPMTSADAVLSVPVPCNATADSTIGGTCAVSTSADGVVPGLVPERARTIWELGQIEVRDGGPDGIASTTPNSAFARQGVFVP